MTGSISPLARAAYTRGTFPLDYSEEQVSTLLLVHQNVTAKRLTDPAAFPGYPVPLTPDGIARQIVATLTEAGWAPTGEPDEEARIHCQAGIDPADYAAGEISTLVL